MGERTKIPHIYRCKGCGEKTHRMWWGEENICPICEKSVGFGVSEHGGLSMAEIEQKRGELRKSLQQDGFSRPSKEGVIVVIRGKERL